MNNINFTKSRGSIVYVFFAAKNDQRTPFYVGESGRGIARISDYISAQFAAPTDYKVGSVARLLEDAGYEVVIEVEESSDRQRDEKNKIDEMSDWPLLNGYASYNYRTAEREDVDALLQQYVTDNF